MLVNKTTRKLGVWVNFPGIDKWFERDFKVQTQKCRIM